MSFTSSVPELTVIIPARNEAENIGATLECLAGNDVPYEVIVVDGASTDGTNTVVTSHAERDPRIQLVSSSTPLGRAQAMNFGIAHSRGGILLFLHADCQLEAGALDSARNAIDAGAPGGGFLKRYDPSSPALQVIAWGLNWVRARGMRRLVGTNAMFCRRSFLERLGGFPDLPLMEDVWLSDRLKEEGNVAVLPNLVTVSARKYTDDGAFRRAARNMSILLRYRCLGTDPEELRELYRRPMR